MAKKSGTTPPFAAEHTAAEEEAEQARLAALDAAPQTPSKRVRAKAPPPAPPPPPKRQEATPAAGEPAPLPPGPRPLRMNSFGYPVGLPITAAMLQERANIIAANFKAGMYGTEGERYAKALHYYKATMNHLRKLTEDYKDPMGLMKPKAATAADNGDTP